MRILFIGDLTVRRYGRRFYSFERRTLSGLIRNDYCVYEFSEKDIARYLTPIRLKWALAEFANRRLLETAEQFRPDLVIMSQPGLISNQTLSSIKSKYRAPLATLTCDPLFAPDNETRQRRRLGVVDALFATTSGAALESYRGRGHVTAYLPNFVDAGIDCLRSFEAAAPATDAMFCGVEEANSYRTPWLARLVRDLDDLALEIHGMFGKPRIFGAQYLDLLGRCKIGLSLNKQEDHLYSSDRISQIMGNGLLAAISRASGLSKFFTDDEALFFSEYEDLVSQIRAHVADDGLWRAKARAGWLKMHGEFSSALATRYVVETTLRQPYSHDYLWRGEVFDGAP